MIKVEKLSYAFPEKDLYKEVSFTIEDGQHCVLIGSNGTGKTTLVDILLHDGKYLYDGKIIRDVNGRYGFTSQFDRQEKERDVTVFEFLAEDFVKLQRDMEEVCKEMETAENIDILMERYQSILDESMSMDADNFESNIRKELKVAGLQNLETLKLSEISGGEYKLLQVIKQILRMPSILVMDEPDVFLDFENLNGLRDLINSYKGTILAITHNRYLLWHCFNKILHLEDCDIQEFDGNFMEYNFSLLAKKIELQEQAAKEQAAELMAASPSDEVTEEDIAEDLMLFRSVGTGVEGIVSFSVEDGRIIYCKELAPGLENLLAVELSDDGSVVVDYWEGDLHDVLTYKPNGDVLLNGKEVDMG